MSRVVATDLMMYSVHWCGVDDFDSKSKLNDYVISATFETALEAAKDCYQDYIDGPIPENFEESLRRLGHEYEDDDIFICIDGKPVYTRKINSDL